MKKSIILATGIALLLPGTVLADRRDNHDCHHAHKHAKKAEYHAHKARQHWRKARYASHDRENAGYRDRVYGRVLSVEPVYRVYSYQGDRNSCIRWQPDGDHGRSWTPTVLGGVIGAAVGYGLGEDHGDPEVATIAGSLLGASVGRDIGRHLHVNRQLQVRGPCTPEQRDYRQREPVEYVVTYRYNGQVYRERMDHDPGEWVKLNVEVSPA